MAIRGKRRKRSPKVNYDSEVRLAAYSSLQTRVSGRWGITEGAELPLKIAFASKCCSKPLNSEALKEPTHEKGLQGVHGASTFVQTWTICSINYELLSFRLPGRYDYARGDVVLGCNSG